MEMDLNIVLEMNSVTEQINIIHSLIIIVLCMEFPYSLQTLAQTAM